MKSFQLFIEIAVYGFALWLGLYLISRNLADGRLRFAGLGLVAYAVGLSLDILIAHSVETSVEARLAPWQGRVLFLPAILWLGLLVQVARGEDPLRDRLRRHPRPFAVIIAASLFFALGLAFIFFPILGVSRSWKILGLGGDLLMLGVAIAVLDAFDEGEALRPHFYRSLYYSLFTALLFAGQVGLAMALGTGVTLPMLLLLLTSIAAALLLQTFSDAFQRLLDRIAFFNYPLIRREREALQTAASALPRVDNALDIATLEEGEFARLTRRALGNMGNLPRLAANPLTRLKLVEQRLRKNGVAAGTLERAGELKTILSESISRLKPRDQGAFGTSDEWRHYNALYFPYVVGLKPYSRRSASDGGDGEIARALQWFRSDVPQRTLYNWQNAAAHLVAQDLREREPA